MKTMTASFRPTKSQKPNPDCKSWMPTATANYQPQKSAGHHGSKDAPQIYGATSLLNRCLSKWERDWTGVKASLRAKPRGLLRFGQPNTRSHERSSRILPLRSKPADSLLHLSTRHVVTISRRRSNLRGRCIQSGICAWFDLIVRRQRLAQSGLGSVQVLLRIIRKYRALTICSVTLNQQR